MDPGILAAWIGVGGTVLVASFGGTIKWIKDLKRKIETLEQAADKQDDVIADLKSQRDRLQITAELQDRFFGQLGPQHRNPRD